MTTTEPVRCTFVDGTEARDLNVGRLGLCGPEAMQRAIEQQEGAHRHSDHSKLAELVFTALGEASMCWSETPSGVFQSERAARVGDDLIAAIRSGEATG